MPRCHQIVFIMNTRTDEIMCQHLWFTNLASIKTTTPSLLYHWYISFCVVNFLGLSLWIIGVSTWVMPKAPPPPSLRSESTSKMDLFRRENPHRFSGITHIVFRMECKGVYGMFCATISYANTYDLQTWLQSKLLHLHSYVTHEYRSVWWISLT